MTRKSKVEMHECANCGKQWPLEKLKEIKHLTERVAPGEIMPSGECPECGAVCHPVEREERSVPCPHCGTLASSLDTKDGNCAVCRPT